MDILKVGTLVSFNEYCKDSKNEIQNLKGVITESENDYVSINAKTNDTNNGKRYCFDKKEISKHNITIVKARKETDIEVCRNVAITLLHAGSFEPIEGLPLCSHTFTNSIITAIKGSDDNPILVNIYEDKEARNNWINLMIELIMKSSFERIFGLVNRPYRMLFVNMCKPYMAKWHFSKMFSEAWVDSENPNHDVNITLKECVKNFKYADAEFLMDSEEYEKYMHIPNTITLYRGVPCDKDANGLSWTSSKETAEWFAHRYGREGYVLERSFNKEDILCYLNSRNEEEYVCDIFRNKEKAKG